MLGWYYVTFGPWTAEATGDVVFRITIGEDTYLSGVCHVLAGRKDPTQPFCSFNATGALQAGPGAEFWYEVTGAPATFAFWVESPSCADTSLCSVPVAIPAGSFTFTLTKVDGPRSDP